ncbi:hypothetical protein [Tenacibaculum ovolyticum]|uniref:hypothetical protein n=1 Tax=Tenacibaculum ovolyticum TaxID=104270 RepID=UPI0007ECD7AE|nr:hypothetical protein [Tenacibaculum ovolyticum]
MCLYHTFYSSTVGLIVSSHFTKKFIYILFLQISFALYNRFIIVNGFLKVFKELINRNYKITVFRRFSKSENINSIVLPVLGAYGAIQLIKDNTLKLSPKAIDADSGEILSENNKQLFSNWDWKNDALRYIKNSDFVVFYWTEPPTDNMIWELDKSIEAKNINKLLIITDRENKKSIKTFLKHKKINLSVLEYNKDSFRKMCFNLFKSLTSNKNQ